MNSEQWKRYPNLSQLVEATEAAWPTHTKALAKSFEKRTDDDLQFADLLSGMVLQLAPSISGGLPDLVEDYRFLCESIILPEEIFFRRNGTYRLSTFEEAIAQVYSRAPFMKRYMNGLLVSCVLWVNHARALQHYRTRFLPFLRPSARLLEIGPGHGLLLCMACRAASLQVSAWDVSNASLSSTRTAAKTLGIEQAIHFEQRDIFDVSRTNDVSGGQFDAIVMSEVLEHLENPREALGILFRLTAPGGLVWINVPVNSPAPDHIFLLGHPDEAADLVSGAGFEVVDQGHFPMNDVALPAAIQKKLTVSCALVARRPMG